jgi:hypothetical protein
LEDPVQRGWGGVRDGCKLSNKYVEAVVASSTLLRGLYLARTRGPEDTVALCVYICKKVSKEFVQMGGDPATFWARRAEGADHFRPVVAKAGGHRANLGGENAPLALLQQVPGFSLKRAQATLAAFGSVADLVDHYRAHPEAGAGRKKAFDAVADLKVGDRRLGEACSKSLRELLFGGVDAVADAPPAKKQKVKKHSTSAHTLKD